MGSSSTNAIPHIINNQVIDRSIVPYIAGGPMMISGTNLRPGACANVWVDDVSVNPFVQSASILTANVGFTANVLTDQEGLYCNTTHAFATVMGTAYNPTGHYVYISENYLSLNLNPYGPANSNSFAAGNYLPGELVYQTAGVGANAYANTWMGRVSYWAPQDGSLHLQTLSGTIANTTSAQTIYKVGSSQLANMNNIVQGNKFPGGSVTSVKNVNAVFTTTAYDHNHGLVANVTALANQVLLAGNPGANVVNSVIQFVYGTGYGQNAKIIAVNNNLVTLNANLSTYSGNTYYGIIGNYINSWGHWYGWHWWAEDGYFNFPVGNRLITINDAPASNSNAATMRSVGTYHAVGQITTSTKAPIPSKPPQVSPAANTTVAPSSKTSSQQDNNQIINNPAASADPMCQTFFTPKPTTQKIDNGIFISSCDLWFAAAPSANQTQFPVYVYIVPTVNGFPTTTILGQASVHWEGVVVTDGVSTFPSQSNTSTNTHFVFDNPVYLSPGTEYGLVVYSESPSYNVWVADLGEPLINSTRLVSPSPFIGAFFKSQNATAWTPIQNRSLMFQLNKAVFNTNPVALQFNLQKPFGQNTFMDSVLLHSSDVTFPPANISYGIKTINANTGNYDANFFTIFNNNPFSFGGDLNTSIISSNRRRLIPAGNVNGTLVQVTLSTNDPDVTPMFHSERLSFVAIQNLINPSGIQASDITITSSGNHINAANIVVTIGTPSGDNPIQATANVLAANLSGNNVTGINILNPGSGYISSPTITLSEPSAPSNATAVVNGEDGVSGGNGYARYVTRQITLADGFDAGDLQIFMTAVRPQGTDIDVYYKVLGSNDNDVLQNKKWILMSKQADLFSPDQATPIDLNFNTGVNSLNVPIGSVNYVQNGVQYPIGGKFKSFAIKIVLFASDPTVPPIINNMRGIAVPSG